MNKTVRERAQESAGAKFKNGFEKGRHDDWFAQGERARPHGTLYVHGVDREPVRTGDGDIPIPRFRENSPTPLTRRSYGIESPRQHEGGSRARLHFLSE